MIVCIAEKPSVARDIAHVLGATAQHDGYLEGAGYQVTWTFGHLCELKQPEDYSETWRRWSLAALPMMPERFGIRLKDDRGVKRQFAVIERLMARAESIVNCGDAGQEGELIQRWVMQKARARCPVKRLWINSLTPEAIREGFDNLKDQSDYQHLYEAGLCRAIGDWLLGMNATRLYTLKYGDHNFRATTRPRPLSIGRVQTPTLALIVRRQEQIDHFKPEPYWVLATVYRNTLFTAVTEEGQRGYKTEEEGAAALQNIAREPFEVTGVEQKKGKEAPPKLFDLTSLQVACNRRWGFTAEQTLNIAQSLYEKKVTTYPRVDTTYLPEALHAKCKATLNGIRETYEALLAPLRGRLLLKRKKVFDNKKVTDHHAIVPTGLPARALTDEENRVYDLVCRHFIANFYPDCEFLATTVSGRAADVPFRTTGKQITAEGWRSVFADDRKENRSGNAAEEEDGDNEKTLPSFTKGETGSHEPSLTRKETQPPKPYTEATLLRAMETAGKTIDDETLREALKENGIGRPSTRAAIIETLFKRNYICRKGKSLRPTLCGCHLIGLINNELLKSASLTGLWESKLRAIERGEYSAARFVEELKTMVASLVISVMADNTPHTLPPATPKEAGGKS